MKTHSSIITEFQSYNSKRYYSCNTYLPVSKYPRTHDLPDEWFWNLNSKYEIVAPNKTGMWYLSKYGFQENIGIIHANFKPYSKYYHNSNQIVNWNQYLDEVNQYFELVIKKNTDSYDRVQAYIKKYETFLNVLERTPEKVG